MAYSTVRIVAGAGAVAASLLLVGPNPPAFADKHGHSNNDHRRGGAKLSSGSANRIASNVVKDVVNGVGAIAGIDSNSKPNLDPPQMQLATSGGDLQSLAVESLAPEGQMALRSAAVAEAPVGDNVTTVAVAGGGSDYLGQSVGAFRSPRVTIGNGRTPGTHVGQGSRRAVLMQDSLMAPDAVPPAAPEAIEINFPPPPSPPVERMRSAELAGEIGYGTTDTVTDPLAGVAGLILIPAVGAVLGYRQARAAQSLRESLRSLRT